MRLKSVIPSHSIYYIMVCCVWFLHGCGIFKFSSVQLPSEIKTFSIQDFITEVSDDLDNIVEKLPDKLAAKLTATTSLRRVEKDGDIQYKGTIKSTSEQTVFKTGDDNRGVVQRLTISVTVSYYYPLDDSWCFKDKIFQHNEDSEDLEGEKDALITKIIGELVDKIYTASIDNKW